jgi:hypothetical protein
MQLDHGIDHTLVYGVDLLAYNVAIVSEQVVLRPLAGGNQL